MSRFMLALSLVASLTTSAFADRADRSVEAPRAAPIAHHQFSHAPAAARPDGDAAQHLDRAALRTKLAANRAANLARFRSYQRKGVFPNNTYDARKLNVWLDDAGHLCAAATVMKLSGWDAQVARIAEQDNFIRLADVSDGPVLDWILTSGLTHDEIAAIQEPMMRVVRDTTPTLVDRRLRRAEDRRLTAKYKQVDRAIVRQARASLDAAVERLLQHPELAAQLLAPTAT
ncbi:MAG: hypothetical protein M3680_26765 [Myxococcota bacterium]|nr:hypothetical protein [Myxococcota bacterium]